MDSRLSAHMIMFEPALSGFLVDRRTRGLSPVTLAFYGRELGYFGQWLRAEELARLDDLSSDAIRRYLLGLADRRNRAGVHCAYRAIRAFFRWVWDEYEPAGKNPVERVKLPMPAAEARPGVALADVQKMLTACDTARDRALVLFLIDTGVRRAELLALDVADVDLDGASVDLRVTKNGKMRRAFMGAKTRKALRVYLRERVGLRPDAPLFANDAGERLTNGSLRHAVRRLAVRAGVKAPGLHDFRRAFALEMLRGGVDLVSLSRLLGHSSLEVTKIYLAQVQEDLQAAHGKAGPGDRLKG